MNTMILRTYYDQLGQVPRMLNLRAVGPRVWPDHLQPLGDNTARKEQFDAWWSRNQPDIGHLHPLLAEQWLYRHWDHTAFAFLPLKTLRWDLVRMTGEQILASVRREISKQLDPAFDYDPTVSSWRLNQIAAHINGS